MLMLMLRQGLRQAAQGADEHGAERSGEDQARPRRPSKEVVNFVLSHWPQYTGSWPLPLTTYGSSLCQCLCDQDQLSKWTTRQHRRQAGSAFKCLRAEQPLIFPHLMSIFFLYGFPHFVRMVQTRYAIGFR